MPDTHGSIAIAVDGPGSAGKGTIARGVAQELGYQYIDTGAMYRSVALFAILEDVSLDDGVALNELIQTLKFQFKWREGSLRILVNEQDVTAPIRDEKIGLGASRVSKHPEVRGGLLQLQRQLGASGGIVMDGRDIGTVVLPDAELKVFIDASLEERARRRHAELVRRGEAPTLTDVTSDLAARDRQDMEREVAPLRQASDAHYLDTTCLSISQAIDVVLNLAKRLT